MDKKEADSTQHRYSWTFNVRPAVKRDTRLASIVSPANMARFHSLHFVPSRNYLDSYLLREGALHRCLSPAMNPKIFIENTPCRQRYVAGTISPDIQLFMISIPRDTISTKYPASIDAIKERKKEGLEGVRFESWYNIPQTGTCSTRKKTASRLIPFAKKRGRRWTINAGN